MIRLASALVVIGTLGSPAAAQEAGGRPGPRKLLPRDWEIALARSAAPAAISAGSRVFVLTHAGYVVADSGTTEVVCLVNRSWPDSLEPECFDPEAAATILPMTRRRTELLARGVPNVEADREIAQGLLEGRYRLPTRPAIVYMMSAAQELIDDEGKPVGAWRPHLMIHYPYLTDQAVGRRGAPGLDGGMVVNAGLPTANLMVVVPNPVAPSPAPR